MQVDEFMAEPTGVGGDALLSTVVNHVASREGVIEAAELDMICGIITSLQGRVSPEAIMIANAKLSALRTAQEAQLAAPNAAAEQDCPAQVWAVEDPRGEEPAPAAPPAIGEGDAAPARPASEPERPQEPACMDESAAAGETLTVAEPSLMEAEPCLSQREPPALVDVSPREMAAMPVMLPNVKPEEMAATCPPELLVKLAARPNPSERLCSLIVSRGHAEALAAILRNPGARFARSSLTTMVELAASDMALREAMCARADLTDMILDRLWPYLSPALKAGVLAAGCARSHAEALLICANAAEEEACEISEDGTLRSVAEWSQAVRNREASLSHAMRTLDREGRIVDVATMLAEFAGIEPAMALALMIGTYDRGAVAPARLAGCDDDSMMSLIHLRGRAGARSTADRRGPLHAFAKLGEDEARSIIQGCQARLTGRESPPVRAVEGSAQRADAVAQGYAAA